jgi:hypothetical protein
LYYCAAGQVADSIRIDDARMVAASAIPLLLAILLLAVPAEPGVDVLDSGLVLIPDVEVPVLPAAPF